ncbi:CsxC family protein [Clostridium grantii]|uniref:DUF7852 domain-containing protein n=1 Tax=Clostridium grantii DSM 8605 TaxID=1121316 RepID=A0A1M5XB34_9CLOT|nr:hypothetical protein [Clostridium grantii]SHH96714.1 hypothetical protein SAMN02745207_03488 [Clostridium grantii DSM 8605]
MIKDDTNQNTTENLDEGLCTSRILDSRTMPCCCNKSMPPFAMTCAPFVAKIPVVKKICSVNINVKSIIKLERFASDIKDIDKEVCITQATLCPIHSPYTHRRYGWVKYQLFLAGYVKKNIRYCKPTCEPVGRCGCVSGQVLCTTCKIPFECSTTVKLPRSKVCGKNESYQKKFETLGEDKLCRDPYAFHLTNYENFEELPYCELVQAVINECDFVKNPMDDGTFKKLEEKMVVSVTLRILQNEEMFVAPGFQPPYGGKNSELEGSEEKKAPKEHGFERVNDPSYLDEDEDEDEDE